jgi:NAD(P)H-dependent FMN reductase
MTSLMIIVGSVRPGRIGLPVAEWVKSQVEAHGGFDIDFVDLLELNLPFMDEPNHPAQRKYTHDHTLAWSRRVDAAETFVFVTPEYNHSLAPALKNALDYLNQEWWRKPVGFVSYGGVSGGSRGVVAMDPIISTVGLVKTGATVEIPFVNTLVTDGVFSPTQRETTIMSRMLAEIESLSVALKPLQNKPLV